MAYSVDAIEIPTGRTWIIIGQGDPSLRVPAFHLKSRMLRRRCSMRFAAPRFDTGGFTGRVSCDAAGSWRADRSAFGSTKRIFVGLVTTPPPVATWSWSPSRCGCTDRQTHAF